MVFSYEGDSMKILQIIFAIFSILLSISGDAEAKTDKVGPGTVLKISVYNHDDLDSVVQVAEDGSIVLPLIGKVHVDKLTIPQVTEKISKQLADGYIINPQVNVFVENFKSKKVAVLGHVNKPGLIDLAGQATLLEVISSAGGLTPEAGDTISIKRATDGQEKVIVIDLNSLVKGGDLTQNIQVQENDSIYVSKAGMCFITGQVKQPGTYMCSSGVTVLKLVALASGFTGKANKSGIKIVRIVNGKKETLNNVDLDMKLVSDDVVVVPESFF